TRAEDSRSGGQAQRGRSWVRHSPARQRVWAAMAHFRANRLLSGCAGAIDLGTAKAPLVRRFLGGRVMPLKIAFQGEPGAFSHTAAHELFAKGKAVPCSTFEDTLAAVKGGDADYGVVPVENSLYGRITDIYHLLPHSGLFIIGEHFLRVEMNLLGVP